MYRGTDWICRVRVSNARTTIINNVGKRDKIKVIFD